MRFIKSTRTILSFNSEALEQSNEKLNYETQYKLERAINISLTWISNPYRLLYDKVYTITPRAGV